MLSNNLERESESSSEIGECVGSLEKGTGKSRDWKTEESRKDRDLASCAGHEQFPRSPVSVVLCVSAVM